MREALQEARNSKGVTQEEVARYLNVTTRHYRSIELGTRGTTENNWIKLFEYYGGNTPLHKLMENTA